MDTVQKGTVTLLKSAITGQKLALPEGFDIAEAYQKTKAHHMASLIYAGAVNCGIDPQKPVMQRLFQGYCRALQINERQMRDLERVFAAFEDNQIDYLPLKGCIMKEMYPRPELRMMGDADVLIRMEQYEQIAPVMKALGFSEGNEIDYHIEWTSDSLCVELHKYPISPKCEEWYAYFQSGWKYAQVKEGTRYAMDDEHTFAFLLTHFAKHYSRAGIGCRHMVDLWVYLRNHPAMDQTYLRSVLKKLRLWEFYQNICRLLAVWFEEEEPDERGEFMTQVIFSNGSWGSSLNAALNDGVRDMGKSGSALHSRIKYLTRRLFPGVMYFKNRYPVLDRHPWLLPVMWCVRLIEKLMSRSVLRKHSRQLSLLKKDELERRKKMLEYVGLDGDEEQ